ncbi:MAG: hypothetical protein A2086_05055 [Spirochaetes bacterium GWD1_27_9]|nr:MAG: hypothetical protein A2Z98_10590 [Spirochaetes bacterium GWB1_27_13]OHD26227.1 MAG: hypothetical protein A2Y34_11215 [Spirochaetes bacterium GWC1_27_15]OHD44588.1 MAG: hypothetical protein A2086_05055 [Spirochaetes bacterium GWD1_27_9]
MNLINFLKIAFRNLGRHKIKTILTVLAISISVMLYIFVDGYAKGVSFETIRNLINYETGVAKIYSKKFYEKKDDLPLYENFGNYDDILKKLESKNFVGSPRVVFKGSLINNNEEFPFVFVGVNPEIEKKVLKYHNYIKEGTFIENGKYNIVLGYTGAKKLDVNVGDTVYLSTVIDKKDDVGNVKHINQLISLKVCGLIKSNDFVINSYMGFLPLDILQDDTGLLLEEKITEIVIRKKDAKESDWITKEESVSNIKNILGKSVRDDLVLISYEEDAKEASAINNANNTFYNVVVLFLSLLAIFGISNTILIATMQRTTEIGMLRALGLIEKDILILFGMEAGLIGFIGSLIGIFFGILINIYMVNYGFDFSYILEQGNFDNIRTVIFKSMWNFPNIILAGIVASLISSLVAIPPTIRALKTSIIDALNFD